MSIASWVGRLAAGDFREWEYRSVRLRNHLHFALTPNGDRDRPMLFVIGHPRTGTLSLHTILVANGIDSCHTAGRWRTWRHDAFGDRGNFQPFRLLNRTYPNSRFVLNTRPAFKYLRSLFAHWHSRGQRESGVVRGRFTRRHVKGEILRRNRHFVDVARYFLDRDNLFVIDIETPGAFDFLCDRMGLEPPGRVWTNRSRARLDPGSERVIQQALEELGIAEDRMNPFVFRSLLDEADADLVDRFLERNRTRIRLPEPHPSPEGGQAPSNLRTTTASPT